MFFEQLVLSLFPGIGMLDSAFESEGFAVVRGPDVLWGGDIRRFHPPAGKFDGVIGGPPCQCFSRLAAMVRHNGYEPTFGNLIPEFERCVQEASPKWFLMENVPGAPIPAVETYAVWSTLLNNRQLGETQNRVRRWTFGVRGIKRSVLMIETAVLEPMEFSYAVTGGGGLAGGRDKRRKSRLPFVLKGRRSFNELCEMQGLPADFDIPPFTVEAKCKAVGNGVPIAMGRAIAKAVRKNAGGGQ